jgi:hypothetical protein
MHTFVAQGCFRLQTKKNQIIGPTIFNPFTGQTLDNPFQLTSPFYFVYLNNKKESLENGTAALYEKKIGMEEK